MLFRSLASGKLRGIHIERVMGKQTTRGIVDLGVRNHLLYEQKGKSYVITGVDTTALGGHMFRDLLEEHISIISVEFGGVTLTKRKMLSDARAAFDERLIEMPSSGFWAEVRRQHRNYKLLDRKIEQDLVMSVAIIVKLMRQAPRQVNAPPVQFDMAASATVPGAQHSSSPSINARTIRAKMAEKRRRQRALTAEAP